MCIYTNTEYWPEHFFKHTYTDVVMTMGFAWIKTYDNFSILSAVKLIVRNFLSVTYLEFVERLLQLFNKKNWLEKKEFFENCYKTIFLK